MKTTLIAVLATIISTSGALAQTNSAVEYRMVAKEKYDVSKPPFISVTIPAGAALENADEIHYSPDSPKPCKVVFQIPAIYNYSRPVEARIDNFPYSPSYFQSEEWQPSRGGYVDMSRSISGPSDAHGLLPKTPLEKQRESQESAIASKAKAGLKKP